MSGYDYIVVGAGSAGAALAARLSENPKRTVLLLEAGPDYRAGNAPPEMQSPNLWNIVPNEKYHWPQLQGRATEKRAPQLYLRGRGLGGSSAINAQVPSRGMPEDYDRWVELGCTGWSSAEVLPTFIRLEDDLDYGDRPYHGRGGPIPITRDPLEQWGVVSRAVREAALTLGYQWSDDHNAPHSTGVTTWASTWQRGCNGAVPKEEKNCGIQPILTGSAGKPLSLLHLSPATRPGVSGAGCRVVGDQSV